jgi:16S rRNA processing protein RimM
LESGFPASGQDGADEFVILGRVSGVHGVRGWVKVYAETREREGILGYNPWYLRESSGWQPRRLLEGRVQSSGVVVARLEGVDDIDQARALIDVEIAVPRAQLPKLGRGEYYWSDLEGLRVVNVEGIELGTVSHLFATGANDVLVVRDGERERLIPFTKDAVRKVDLAARVIRVDWDPEF